MFSEPVVNNPRSLSAGQKSAEFQYFLAEESYDSPDFHATIAVCRQSPDGHKCGLDVDSSCRQQTLLEYLLVEEPEGFLSGSRGESERDNT